MLSLNLLLISAFAIFAYSITIKMWQKSRVSFTVICFVFVFSIISNVELQKSLNLSDTVITNSQYWLLLTMIWAIVIHTLHLSRLVGKQRRRKEDKI